MSAQVVNSLYQHSRCAVNCENQVGGLRTSAPRPAPPFFFFGKSEEAVSLPHAFSHLNRTSGRTLPLESNTTGLVWAKPRFMTVAVIE